jgi:hypothetical protein
MDSTPQRFSRVLGRTYVVAAFVLAGCSGGGNSDVAGQAPASVKPSAPQSTRQEDPASPLEEFLGFRVAHRPEGLGTNVPELNPDSPGPTEEDRRDQLRVEQMIGECMRAEGFDYEVRDPFATLEASLDQSPYALPREEFAARYGYGISTIDLPDATDVDPNYAAMARMTPAQLEAYLLALDGRAEQGDAENTGCRGAAVKAIFGRSIVGGRAGGNADKFGFLVEEIGKLGRRVDDDPRVARDGNRRWGDCMADAGHPGLTKPSDAPDSVKTRLAETPVGDPAVRAEVRRYELALAEADFVCRQAYDAGRRVVRDELERGFLDEHRQELDRYRRAMKADGSGR